MLLMPRAGLKRYAPLQPELQWDERESFEPVTKCNLPLELNLGYLGYLHHINLGCWLTLQGF